MAQNTLRNFDFASLQSDPVPGIVAGLEGLRNQGIQDRLLALKEQAAQQVITDRQSIQDVLQQQLGGGVPGLTEPQGIVAGEGIVPGDLSITPGGSIGVQPSQVKPFTQSVADTERKLAVGLLGIKGGKEAFAQLSNVFKTGREDEILAIKKDIEDTQSFALKLDRATTRKARNKLLEEEQSKQIIDTGQIDPELLRMRNMNDDELQGEIISDLAIGDSLTKLVDNRLIPPEVKAQTDIGKAQQDLNAGLITKEDFNKLKNVAPDFKSKVGKLMGDKKSAINVFGKDSPQVKAFDSAIKAEIEGEGPKLSDVKGIRDSFSKLSGDFVKIGDAFKKVNASKPTAAGDLSMIFNFMKILDPTSVVREGEFATAASAGPLIDAKTLGLYNRIVKGTRLLPIQRRDFKATALAVFTSQIGDQLRREEEFTGIAERAGINPKDVVLDFVGPFRKVGGKQTIGRFKVKVK